MGLAWVCTRSSAYMLGMLAWCSHETPNSGCGCGYLWLTWLPLRLFSFHLVLTLLYLVLSSLSLRGQHFFLKERTERGVVLERGEEEGKLGGVEGRETRLSVRRIYFQLKKSIYTLEEAHLIEYLPDVHKTPGSIPSTLCIRYVGKDL